MKTHIVLHHSATQDDRMFSWAAIRKYHMSNRIDGVIVSQEDYVKRRAEENGTNFEDPWKNIGYHYGIELIGDAYEILIGRFSHEVGAHCKDLNMNAMAIGVCMVGNFDKANPSPELWKKAKGLISHLMLSNEIMKKNVIGHREVQAAVGIPLLERKTCPGAFWDMNQFREEL